MNKTMRIFLLILGAIIIGGGSLALGALSVSLENPQPSPKTVAKSEAQKQEPAAITLEDELPVITTVMVAAYPKISTDYTASKGSLYEGGEWYGTVLTYKGTDSMNRDTLRVLMQKKDGQWILRTTPPELLLSSQKYKDVPVSVLKSINEPVSLPGTDTSPTINPGE